MTLRVKEPEDWGVHPDRVRRARIEAGLSQVELAHLIGCSPRAVQYWESRKNGIRHPMTRYIRSLAEATGKPIHWFFAEEAA